MAISQKGAISFALVYIPVELYSATQDNGIRFNQLTRGSMGRVRYKKVDESSGKEVKNEDIVKGYEYDKGKYVVITDEDFEKVKTEKDRSIEVIQFTDMPEICPIYYDRSYYVVPQKGGEKAFELFRRAMFETDKVAVGQTVMGSTEVSVALIPDENAIYLHTLFFEDEVKDLPNAFPQPEVTKAELDMAEKIISTMEKPFDPGVFKDEYQQKLRELIQNKIEGKEVSVAKPAKSGNIINLMDALKASLDNVGGPKKAKPKKTPRAKKAAGA